MFDFKKIIDKAKDIISKENNETTEVKDTGELAEGWLSCPHCGQLNRNDFDKCVFCGKDLSTPKQTKQPLEPTK